jgi:hypothetical protein
MWNPFKGCWRIGQEEEELPEFLTRECFIAVSKNEEGDLFFDFSFNDETFSEFIDIFSNLSTGLLCASMCDTLMEHLESDGRRDLAARFLVETKEKTMKIMSEYPTQTNPGEEIPIISPMDVFTGGNE